MTKKTIQNWNKATNNLAIAFVTKYYGKECVEDMHWIGDEIGDILMINDEFWNVDRMKQALEFKATDEQLMEYYYYEIELPRGESAIINFKNYLKLGATWIKK